MDRIERNYYLTQLIEKRDNGRVKVITGIRRCGKSVLLFDIFGDYLKDVGLRNAQLNFRQQEETHLMENVIFNELCVRGFNVDVGVVEYNYKDELGKSKRTKLEVDFVVNRGNRRCYIQSAFAIPDEEKRKQETNSLQRINDSYRKIVVVHHHIVPWYDENGIYYVGLEDFCLSYIDELDTTL